MVVNTYVKRTKVETNYAHTYRKMSEKEDANSLRVQLCKDKMIPYMANKLDEPQKIAELMFNLFEINYLADEYMYLLGFDSKANLLGIMEIAHGTVNECIASPREIFQAALLMNASFVVLLHNHPSGECTPSSDDMKSKERIQKAGELLNVRLLDYIVLGRNEYYSASERNEM